MSEPGEEMKIDSARASALISQLGAVKDRIAAVAGGRTVSSQLDGYASQSTHLPSLPGAR
jgi:hypothetical protein